MSPMIKLRGFLIPALEKEYLGVDATIEGFIIKIRKLVSEGSKVIQLIHEKDYQLFKEVKIKFPQLILIGGGNIQSINDAKKCLVLGSDFVVVERAIVSSPKHTVAFIRALGDRLVVSISDKNGFVSQNSDLRTLTFCKMLVEDGVNNIIYVNDNKKLMNSGIHTEWFSKVREIARKQTLIYSGGVSTIEDIKTLKLLGADSIIAGTALYRKYFSFNEGQSIISLNE